MASRPPEHESKSRLLPWVALVVVWIVWGATYLGMRVVVHEMPPLAAGALRFCCAGLIMGLVRATSAHARRR